MIVNINGTIYEQRFKTENVINCKFCDLSKAKYRDTKACHSLAERYCSDIVTSKNQTGKTMPFFKKKRVIKQNKISNQTSLF